MKNRLHDALGARPAQFAGVRAGLRRGSLKAPSVAKLFCTTVRFQLFKISISLQSMKVEKLQFIEF